MAPPRGRGGARGRGRGGRVRGSAGGRRQGSGGGGADGKGRGRGSRDARPESDPGNEHLYTDTDRFHTEKDKIALDGGDSDSEDTDESEQEEAVMDLEDGGDSGSSDDDDDDSLISDLSDLPELPEHVRRAAMEASSDDESDDGDDGKPKFAAGWGKKRSAYYNADTADLEIGQEFEDAEAEEEAALELQRASYKRLDPADFGEEEEGEGHEVSHVAAKGKGNDGRGSGGAGTARNGAALLSMKSDLEQLALGSSGEVETSVVKRDPSQLSRRDKLELVLSDAPELPALLGEVRAHMEALTNIVQPLVSNVTADLGASDDGLEYLRTRQQLLLAYCMNACFYMMLKARGEPAKGHPVVRRLLSLRELLGDMSALDETMKSQVDLLLRALAAGVNLAGAGSAGDSGDDASQVGDNDSDAADAMDRDGTAGGGTGDVSEVELDEERLAEEEARFMGNERDVSKSEDDMDEAELSAKAIKKRRKAARKKTLADAKATVALGQGNGDAALGDYGDEEVDDELSTEATNGGGGGNLLQGMVNRITQRERATSGKRKGLQGDLDVPFRERDQTIRVRRPAPGESGSEDGGGCFDAGDCSGGDSDDSDLGLGAGGFMAGLPPGLVEELSRGGSGDGGGKKGRKGKRRRETEPGQGADGRGEDGVNEFYESVAHAKERKKRAKQEKYHPESRIAGALEAELEAERAARGGAGGEDKRGASYSIIKNRGLTPHKNKLNRNPRAKKREAFRKATIRRKGQVRDIRKNEADAYGGEQTGIRANVTRSRRLNV